MSVSESRAPILVAKLATHAWWIILLCALAVLWLATERRIERVDAITNSPTWSVDAPRRDATSPTGFEQGQRTLIAPGHHGPSFSWIMEAQQSVAQGAWRLRHIDYEAPPEGHEIRRTAPYRWWLIAVGWLYGSIHGEPLGFAIERGALIADPLLLALLLILGALYSARYIGSFAAIGFAIGGISIFPLAANFQPGAPDPHSLAWVLALGSILPLLAPPQKTGTRRRAHFVVAGVFGGLGLWNDATSQTPLLLATLLGAICYELIRCRGADQPQPAPSHWRAWALTGALMTLGASLFEYAPNHLSWSLDFVNPLHAIIWWGLGEALIAVGIWSRQGRKGFDWRSLTLLGVASLAIASWPVVGILSNSGSFLASDFYARELANHPSGGMATSLGAWFSSADSGTKIATLLPCGLFLFLLWRFFLGRIEREERGRIAFIAVPAIFTLVLACLQLRLWNLFDALALAVLTLLFAESGAKGIKARVGAVGATLLLLPGLFVGFPAAFDGNDADDLSQLEVQALIARDFSYWLNKRAGPEPNVLFSTPIFSGAAAFYGGFDVIVSGDDENKTGHQTAVRLASSSSAREIPILLNSRGITHVALPLWDPTMVHFVRIGRNVPNGEPLPTDAFWIALQIYSNPTWLRPMNYTIPQVKQFKGFALPAFAFAAEEEADVGLSRLTDVFVERGQLREAKMIRKTLEAYPRSVHALAAIANIDFALRDKAALEKSLETLIPYLSRRSARNLPAGRRISLGALFIRTNHPDLARDQLTACFETLDVETLRTLTPPSVFSLFMLSLSLDIPFPDEEMEAVAMELIPPNLRSRLMQK